MRIVFVHGSGQSGSSAWPEQQVLRDKSELVFFERLGYAAGEADQPTDFEQDRQRTIAALADGAHLVAHSYGAIAAMMAAEAAPEYVHSIVMFEPACLSLARGLPAVEAHIEAMTAALAEPSLSDDQFMAAFLASLGVAPPTKPLNAAGRENARRLRLQRGPWEASLDPAVIARHRTLVVTSGGSALSEEVANALAALGAEHATVAASGHRPQDHAAANALLLRHWAA